MEIQLALINRVMKCALATLDPGRVLEEGCSVLAKALEMSNVSVSWLGKEPVHYVYPDSDIQNETARTLKDNQQKVLMLPLPINGEVGGLVKLSGPENIALSAEKQTLADAIVSAIGCALGAAQRFRQLEKYANSLESIATRRTFDLRSERDRNRCLLESVGDAVILADIEGMVRYINVAAVALTGYAQHEAWGLHWSIFACREWPSVFYEEVQNIVCQGRSWSGQVALQRNQGGVHMACMTVTPHFNLFDREQPVGFVIVIRDRTPQLELDRLKDQFISQVSHELRTPLSVLTLMSGNLDILYQQIDDEKRREMIRGIREYASVLNSLINDLFYAARLENSFVSNDKKILDLSDIVHKEVALRSPLAHKKHLKLSVLAKSLMVRCNEEQLKRIVHNLLMNALQYTESGGEISVECSVFPTGILSAIWPGSEDLPAGRWAALQVADSGPGIREDELPFVFDRFFRGRQQPEVPGTGLGLSIARELVELNNGHIAVSSHAGVGSVFAVYLPLENSTEG